MRQTPFTRHFFVDGHYLGSAPAGFRRRDGKEWPPLSYTFSCSHCGEQWARCPIVLGEGPPHRFDHNHMTCRKCKDQSPSLYRIPGSLWRTFDESFVESLSEEALRREMELHLRAYDNEWN